jgi:hypothetical protein
VVLERKKERKKKRKEKKRKEKKRKEKKKNYLNRFFIYFFQVLGFSHPTLIQVVQLTCVHICVADLVTPPQ